MKKVKTKEQHEIEKAKKRANWHLNKNKYLANRKVKMEPPSLFPDENKKMTKQTKEERQAKRKMHYRENKKDILEKKANRRKEIEDKKEEEFWKKFHQKYG